MLCSRVPENFAFTAWLSPDEIEFNEQMRLLDLTTIGPAVIYISDENKRLTMAKHRYRFSTVGILPATGTIDVDFFLSTPVVTDLTGAVNFIEHRLK